MKRIALLFALCLLTIVGASWADTPTFIDESTYPTFNHPLTAAEQAHLGLSAKILREPLEVLNRVGPSSYKFARLEPGDVVLVDRDGTPRYKASCGNRIEALPIKVTVIAPTQPAPPIAKALPAASFGDSLWSFITTKGKIILALLLLLLAAALVAGITYLGALSGGRRRTSPPAPAPAPRVTPLVSPAPGTVSPAPTITPPLTPSAHPLFLWTIRNGSVEWDTALVASTIESGVGADGATTLEVRLTARPPATTP
ncbi:hypothetical protein IPJ70_00770 [Candidatus Campbellbacteria bacterium]|nr:MAG: hypothetical protein IPJ70_00770 [Candidatus Campbellbacteria bacterium]